MCEHADNPITNGAVVKIIPQTPNSFHLHRLIQSFILWEWGGGVEASLHTSPLGYGAVIVVVVIKDDAGKALEWAASLTNTTRFVFKS